MPQEFSSKELDLMNKKEYSPQELDLLSKNKRSSTSDIIANLPLSIFHPSLPGTIKDVTSFLNESQIPIGAAAGATIGAVSPIPGGTTLGGFLGGTLGSGSAQAFQNISPSFFGEPPEKGVVSIQEAMKDSLINELVTKYGSSLAKKSGKLLEYTGKKIPEVGELTDLIKKKLTTEGKEIIPSRVPSPEATAEEAGRSILSRMEARKTLLRGEEKAAFESFTNNHADTNNAILSTPIELTGKTIDPSTGLPAKTIQYLESKVKGPIFTEKASTLANEIKPDLDTVFNKEYPLADPIVQGKLSRLKNAVDSLAGEIQTTGGQVPVVKMPNGSVVPAHQNLIKEFEKVKQLRTDIRGLTEGVPLPNRTQGGLRAIAANLGDDIENSIANYWQNPTAAQLSLEKANRASKTLHTVISDQISDQMAKAQAGQVAPLIDAGFKNPELLGEMISASGRRSDFAVEGFNRLISDYTKGDQINWRGIANEFQHRDYQPIARRLYNKETRDALNNMFTVLGNSDPTLVSKGLSTFTYMKNRAIFNASTDVLRGQPAKLGPAGALLGISLAGREFFSALMNKPKYIRMAAELAKIPPNSARAQALEKNIFGVLKGAQVLIMTPDGKGVETTLE